MIYPLNIASASVVDFSFLIIEIIFILLCRITFNSEEISFEKIYEK